VDKLKRGGRLPERRSCQPSLPAKEARRPRRNPPLAGALLTAGVLLASAVFALPGCGGGEKALGEEEQVVERALRSAFAGEDESFLKLVDPSFVEEARAEMPDADDETLGGVLLSGFLRDIPYRGLEDSVYQVEVEGDRAVVHVWGAFVDGEGREVAVAEEEAIRVPLRREGGRWYLDLLDL